MNSPSKSPASFSSGLPLRQLRWPELSPVDLLDECDWLITLDATNANLARKNTKAKQSGDDSRRKISLPNGSPTKDLSDLSKQKSPYRQPLRRSRPPAPSPGSPAQRAAKSILKLKEGLLRLDGTETHDESMTMTAIVQHHDQQASDKSSSVSRLIDFNGKDKLTGLGSPLERSPSLNRAKTPLRSPSRKKKKRPPTREECELAEKQTRLAAWLTANPDAANSIENGGRAYRDDGTLGASTPLYSTEVSTRIESALQCHGPLESGVRLWDDPVRSLLAAEMTSESVFGGAVPTRALAFLSPQAASPSPPNHSLVDLTQEELNIVEAAMADECHEDLPASDVKPELSDHARKVFDTAHLQVIDGDVADALETLHDGIRQALSISQAHLDAVSGSNRVGFNYSELAHKSATKLQLCYRSRHRRRVNRLIFLQRQWRWWHTRHRMLSSVQYANEQAIVLQRHYRPWYRHITRVRSAVRIQRCFRVFECQKFVLRFRQLGRLLLARKAQHWRLKTRMRMIGKWLLLYRRRRRRIALVQSLWRRRCARAQLELLLDQARALEQQRRAREDEFVAARLDKARLRFRDFLTNTKRGRELVRWQAEKPWLRFRRLRRQWDKLSVSDKVNAVARVLPGRRFRGLHQRALCQMLVGTSEQLPALPKVLKVSVEELSFLATPITVESPPFEAFGCTCCPWWARVREKVKITRSKLSRRAATLWWSFVTYPREYCVCLPRRDEARQQLEDDCARVLAAFLRVWFRRIDSKTSVPPYECEWCSEPFGISREYFAHGKCAAARARADAEWTALSSDLEFSRRSKWRQPHKTPTRPDIHAFDLDASSVRRLRRTCSRRKALRSLVATLEACTANDSADAGIPLDVAGFVLQYLDDDGDFHPLMQTAEYQIVRWNTLVGPMAVKKCYELKSRWIRRDELHSRLIVGSRWRSVLSRWQRAVGRKCRGVSMSRDKNALSLKTEAPRFDEPSSPLESALRTLQFQLRRLIPTKRGPREAQYTATSPPVAGSRVLPVAT